MLSQLHARKKALYGPSQLPDVETPSAGSSPGGSARLFSIPRQHFLHSLLVKKKRFRGTSEVLISLFSICAFLAVGLLLGYFLLHHKHRTVILHVMQDPLGHGRGVVRGRQGFRHHFYTGAPRFVTVVLPSVVNQQGRTQRLRSIQDTWGGSARAIFVVHNISEFPQASHAILSDTSTPEDHYAYPQLLLLPDEIGSEDGVSRLIYTIRTVHKMVNPDFAFFVNDHTYVIPAHLCKYLEGRPATGDMYEGHALRNGNDEVFNSGAAGYLLSRATMQKLVERFDAGDPVCAGNKANTWLQNNPGLVTLKCLNSLGIYATDTRGAQKWHRFHAFPLTRLVEGNIDDWYRKKHLEMDQIAGFDSSYNELLPGEDCCSKDTISFHYVEWKESRALFAIQEELLEHPHLSDHEVKLLMQKEWPSSHQEIGAYSRGLPKDSDRDAWNSLVRTIRKISTRGTQRDC